VEKRNLKNMINKQAIISSNVASAGWDNEVMEVSFKSGGTYRASGVSKNAYDLFMAAQSKGKHFNQILKTAYKWEKV
jgi:hypothetical protein